MDNKEIVKNLRQTASFMELHGENEFKIRSYNNAVYNIERTTDPLSEMDLKELESVNGIGKSIAARIHELIQTNKIESLDKLISQTPEGIVEMMNVKGLGTKKTRTLWQELDITTLEDLQAALKDGRISQVKGFGGKVQENIAKSLNFYLHSKSKIHYFKAEPYSQEIVKMIKEQFPSDIQISETGELRRKMEIIEILEFIIGTENSSIVHQYLSKSDQFIENKGTSPYTWVGSYSDCPIPVKIYLCKSDQFFSLLTTTSGSVAHLLHPVKDNMGIRQIATGNTYGNEEEIYRELDLPYIEPELREGIFEFEMASENTLPKLLETTELKGIIHNHSHYSDGKHSLRDMAEYCRSLGYEYLGISDHSKAAAFYANGMDEDRVKKQHDEIEKLNIELAPFKIFKGIEADILPDGDLDYDPEILASFDFVVASVHSVLNMDLEKAMKRMLKAIENPFTTILGHLTGRQLLIREGYPIDHKEIIDACSKNNVIIEINSHPHRLDLDWRWVHYALEKKVMLSINPDAHSKEGYDHMKFGVNVGRKGGLTAKYTFNTKSRKEVEQYFKNRRPKATKAISS